MIEVPEASVLARQMNDELRGKRIVSGVPGNAPHKFAFYSRPPAGYEATLSGRTMGEVREHGSAILASIEPEYTLVLGGGGERVLFHRTDSTLPRKHQLLLDFGDNTYLTVSVQGWGNVLLLHRSELADHPHAGQGRISALGDAFTMEHFLGLFGELAEADARSVKFFLISQPGAWGMGNGYLQDILFRAELHPRRRAVDVAPEERKALFEATRETLTQAATLGGRDTERDLYNHPGGYRCVLDRRSVGLPCTECGTPIEKTQYLGGACYFCPGCQV